MGGVGTRREGRSGRSGGVKWGGGAAAAGQRRRVGARRWEVRWGWHEAAGAGLAGRQGQHPRELRTARWQPGHHTCSLLAFSNHWALAACWLWRGAVPCAGVQLASRRATVCRAAAAHSEAGACSRACAGQLLHKARQACAAKRVQRSRAYNLSTHSMEYNAQHSTHSGQHPPTWRGCGGASSSVSPSASRASGPWATASWLVRSARVGVSCRPATARAAAAAKAQVEGSDSSCCTASAMPPPPTCRRQWSKCGGRICEPSGRAWQSAEAPQTCEQLHCRVAQQGRESARQTAAPARGAMLPPPRRLPPQPGRTATPPFQPRACRPATRRPAEERTDERKPVWDAAVGWISGCATKGGPRAWHPHVQTGAAQQACQAHQSLTRNCTCPLAYVRTPAPPHPAIKTTTQNPRVNTPARGRWRTCALPAPPSSRRATRPRRGRPWGSDTRLAPPSGCCATRLRSPRSSRREALAEPSEWDRDAGSCRRPWGMPACKATEQLPARTAGHARQQLSSTHDA